MASAATATARRLLEEIFASKRVQCAISLTGGGGNVAGEILGTSGASSTLLEVSLPYYQQSLIDFLSLPSEVVNRESPARFSFASQEVSMLMAKKSLERARALVPLDEAATCVGIGCTAALVSLQPRRGSHRAFVTLSSVHGTYNFNLDMHKGARSRKQEDECVGNLIVLALSKAANVDVTQLRNELTPHELDSLTEDAADFDNSLSTMLQPLPSNSLAIFPNNVILRDMPWKRMLVVPGSFNPVHQGHIEFALAAQRLLQKVDGGELHTPLFELSIKNADKGTLVDVADISRRVHGLVDTHNQRLVLTNASLFVDKAKLFPSSVFAVGADTAVRLVDPKYYGNDAAKLWMALSSIASHKCRFVVAGRLVSGNFVSADEAVSKVPSPFQHLFLPLPEADFRLDLSSTEIRERLKGVASAL